MNAFPVSDEELKFLNILSSAIMGTVSSFMASVMSVFSGVVRNKMAFDCFSIFSLFCGMFSNTNKFFGYRSE